MLQIKKDYILQIGLVPTDVLFQYTTVSFEHQTHFLTSVNVDLAVYSDCVDNVGVFSHLSEHRSGSSCIRWITAIPECQIPPATSFKTAVRIARMIYDDSKPDHDCRVTVFGTSAKFLTDLKDSNIRPSNYFAPTVKGVFIDYLW